MPDHLAGSLIQRPHHHRFAFLHLMRVGHDQRQTARAELELAAGAFQTASGLCNSAATFSRRRRRRARSPAPSPDRHPSGPWSEIVEDLDVGVLEHGAGEVGVRAADASCQ